MSHRRRLAALCPPSCCTWLAVAIALGAPACADSLHPAGGAGDPVPADADDTGHGDSLTGDALAGDWDAFPNDCAATHPFRVVGTWSDSSHDVLLDGDHLFATNSVAGLLMVYDTTTDTEVAAITTGPVPYNMTRGAGYVFTVNIAAREDPDEIVTVVSTTSLTRVAGVPIPWVGEEPASYPWDAYEFGNELYVVNNSFSTPSVFPVSLSTFEAGTPWPAGSGASSITVAGDHFFISNERAILDSSDDAIAVFDLTGAAVTVLETSGPLRQMITGPDGRVYVARETSEPGSGRVLAIDPTTYAITELPVADRPFGLAATEHDLYVTSVDPPVITVLQVATGLTRRIDVTGFTPAVTKPRGIAVTRCGDIYLESEGQVTSFYDPRRP